MKDYKAMFHHLSGQMEMSAEILGMATEFLKTANNSVNEIIDAHEKTIENILTDSNKSIANILADNKKSIKEISAIVNVAALKFDMIRVKMETAEQRTEEKFSEEEQEG